MESFVCGGKEIVFWQVTGEVIGTNKFNETHVSSSGGGGYVGQYGGYVGAPTVRSSIVTNHEIWIKTEGGKEQDIKFRGVDIPLRVGQKITLIAAGKKKENSGYWSVLVNHNTRQHWFINKANGLIQKLFNTRFSKFRPVIFIVICIVLANIMENMFPSDDLFILGMLVILFSVALITLPVKKIRKIYIDRKLNIHLEKLAQLTYR